jgi:uncharacterized RDD family membrane protein YckC
VVLAREARAAARAAEAASKAAQEAHAAAQSVLASLEGASADDRDWELQRASEDSADIRATGVLAQAPQESDGIMLVQNDAFIADADEPGRPDGNADPARAQPESRRRRIAHEAQRDAPHDAPQVAVNAGGASGAPEPIYANLIHFPREVVATRRLRPRRAEGPLADATAGAQLSIFEVDPSSILTEPALAPANEPAAPDWMRAEWAEIELDREPQRAIVEEPELPASLAAALIPAPLSWRLMAFVVDTSLVVLTFLAIVRLAAAKLTIPIRPHTFELCAVLAILAIGAAYETLFFTLAKATPGMMYAGIALSTFDGCAPNREQRSRRLMAMPLSVLPLCMGLLWAFLDNDLLTWHDRLSETYLRKL